MPENCKKSSSITTRFLPPTKSRHSPPVNSKEIFTAEADDHDELKCPACDNMQMEHFNYGDTSGIILHKCPSCGGIWTDKDQLEKVEEVVDGWKADLDQDSEEYGPLLDKVEMEEQKELDRSVSISRFGFVNAVLRRFCE